MAAIHTCLLILLLAVVSVSAQQRNYTIIRYLNVSTTQGVVRGGVIETSGAEDGTVVQIGSFLGINFAKVPTAEFRFAHPVYTEWDFVQDALTFDPPCFQDPGRGGDYNNMAESCIAANIWTPFNGTSANPGNYPVVVWIHGGRFETGSIADQTTSGRVLTSHEAIVTVNLQYRLGVLGFLRLSSTVAPGNMGLKDQALGLRFIHENIARFGGNPQTITLMGIDAGAASIGYHMLNDQTKNYFKRAIMLGGSPMVFWSVRQDTHDIERLHQKFAKDHLDCDTDKGMEEAIKCLREVAPTRLINAQKEFAKQFQGVEFPPVIDGDYIKEDPLHAFQRGAFDAKELIIGVTNSEAARYIENSLEQKNWTKRDLADAGKYRAVLEDNFRTFEREPDLLSGNGRQFLVDRFTSFGNPSEERNYRRWLDAASERLFICPSNQFADLVASKTRDIYYYVFSEQDGFTTNYVGASHGQDAYYFFGNPSDDAPIVKPEQKLLSDRMMDYLAKFAASGDPVPRDDDNVWARYNSTHKSYHNFSSSLTSGYNVHYGFHSDDCAFWGKTLKYVNPLESKGPFFPSKVRSIRETSGGVPVQDASEQCKNVINSTTLAILIPLLISNVALLGVLAWLLIKFCALP